MITSGLGPSVSNALVLSPAGQIHAIALPLVMLATLVCGAVIPEAAAYIIMALALAPFLEELGYSRVASHMFVFYFSIFATIIPPVAITAMAAARLAGASFMDTALRAMKLAFIGPIYGGMGPVEVPKDAPPMFNAIATDDFLFRGQFGVIKSWYDAGVPVEFHLYQNGGHGFGLGNPNRTSNGWFPVFIHWLDVNGFLKAGAAE